MGMAPEWLDGVIHCQNALILRDDVDGEEMVATIR
jgi:hypothetical protein